MKYTEEQLVLAQQKYNKKYMDNPKEFGNQEVKGTLEEAANQIGYLLALVEK